MSSSTYRKRVADGLCGDCGEPSTTARCASCNTRLRSYKKARTPEQKAKHAAYMREYYRNNPEKWRDEQLRRKYGITLDEYQKLFTKQHGECAICGSAIGEISRQRPLFVDHCHATGRVRGLLCGSCNRGIACFNDDPVRLRTAAKYLGRKL
jgi:ribosomal protein L34E